VRPAPAPTLRRRGTLAAAAAVVAVAVHLWGLYRDAGPPSVPWFTHADKVQHLVGFGLPCFLVLLALDLRRAPAVAAPRTVAVVVGAFVAHAVVSEVVQGTLYTTRSGDPVDALADVLGTALGLGALLLVRRRRRAAGRRGRGAGSRAVPT
jgi:VanZ family protein